MCNYKIKKLEKNLENPHLKIENSTLNDFEKIFSLYKIATEFQKTKSSIHWQEFKIDLIKKEILENRQFKITIDGKIVCIWAITYDDALIWEEKDKEPSIYLHRIVTSPNFRGQNMLKKVIEWAKIFALANNKQYLRLDTFDENKALVNYYIQNGFDYLGFMQMKKSDNLPAHYENAKLALLQMKI